VYSASYLRLHKSQYLKLSNRPVNITSVKRINRNRYLQPNSSTITAINFADPAWNNLFKPRQFATFV